MKPLTYAKKDRIAYIILIVFLVAVIALRRFEILDIMR